MNAVSEMSKCFVVLIIFLFQFQFPSISSFSTVYRHDETGRKLFGGYRIVPKRCTSTSDRKEDFVKTGVCMFNYECNRRGGQMIASCLDGFLFGVCCFVPESLSNDELENDGGGVSFGLYGNTLSWPSSKRTPSISTGSTTQTESPTPKFSRQPEFTSESTGFDGIFTASEDPDDLIGSLVSGTTLTTPKKPPSRKPILEQYFGNQTNGGFIDNDGFLPVNSYEGADTILLNPDGTIAENDHSPDVFTPPKPNQTSKRPPLNKITLGYRPTEEHTFTLNNFASTTTGLNTKFQMGSTFTSSNKLTTRPFINKFSAIIQKFPPLNSYMTNPNEGNQAFSTHVKYTKPETATTTTFYKKTDSIPKPVTTDRPNLPFIIINDNLVLLANSSRRPTTTIPVQPTQSTSKASNKPTFLTSGTPVKPTISSTVDLDDKFPGFNYDSYSGISKPPILISHPEGLDDGGQAISHIIGILNTTNPKPQQVETVTRPLNSDGGLSTWVSILGDEKPTKNKFSTKPTAGRPVSGVTTTAYIHGPSFSVAGNDNKPVPTVVVISSDSVNSAYYTKPTKKPSSTYISYVNNNKITSKKPDKPMSDVTSKPQRPTDFYQNNVFHTGQENLINFPPVRNPDLNATALNQVEKPTIVETYNPDKNEVVQLPSGITLEVVPDNELNTIDPDEDYSDFTTPSLQEDKVQNSVHSFVEKIVNSLAGNFQDLEQVLFKNDNKTSITNANGIQLNNIQIADESDKTTTPASATTFTSTKKPIKRPSTNKPPELYDTTLLEISGSTKPRPTTKKPSSVYSDTTTKKPTTQVLTTISSITTPTRRPTIFSTTRRPGIITISRRPTTVTTRRPIFNRPRPRPTTSPTTTTRTPTPSTAEAENEVFDEVTEEVNENDEVTATEAPLTSEAATVDFRRECGVRPMVKKGGRIVGGKGSQFGYYPWQVLVRESTWLGLFTKNKCGGVLITNRYVITAAHCQPGFLASLVAVFGEYDISGELESRRSVAKNVRRVIVHRQYDPATFENDLALLELDSPVTYEEHIVPICMPKEGEDYVGRMATVTGWGRLKYGGGVPSVLQEVRVPLIENSVCQEMFQTAGHQKRIISSFLCAGYANGQKDSCEGDSGGPLMVEREDGHWVLLGTVSHGIKCAAPYLPGVYMRTTYYKPWLKSITGVST